MGRLAAPVGHHLRRPVRDPPVHQSHDQAGRVVSRHGGVAGAQGLFHQAGSALPVQDARGLGAGVRRSASVVGVGHAIRVVVLQVQVGGRPLQQDIAVCREGRGVVGQERGVGFAEDQEQVPLVHQGPVDELDRAAPVAAIGDGVGPDQGKVALGHRVGGRCRRPVAPGQPRVPAVVAVAQARVRVRLGRALEARHQPGRLDRLESRAGTPGARRVLRVGFVVAAQEDVGIQRVHEDQTVAPAGELAPRGAGAKVQRDGGVARVLQGVRTVDEARQVRGTTRRVREAQVHRERQLADARGHGPRQQVGRVYGQAQRAAVVGVAGASPGRAVRLHVGPAPGLGLGGLQDGQELLPAQVAGPEGAPALDQSIAHLGQQRRVLPGLGGGRPGRQALVAEVREVLQRADPAPLGELHVLQGDLADAQLRVHDLQDALPAGHARAGSTLECQRGRAAVPIDPDFHRLDDLVVAVAADLQPGQRAVPGGVAVDTVAGRIVQRFHGPVGLVASMLALAQRELFAGGRQVRDHDLPAGPDVGQVQGDDVQGKGPGHDHLPHGSGVLRRHAGAQHAVGALAGRAGRARRAPGKVAGRTAHAQVADPAVRAVAVGRAVRVAAARKARLERRAVHVARAGRRRPAGHRA